MKPNSILAHQQFSQLYHNSKYHDALYVAVCKGPQTRDDQQLQDALWKIVRSSVQQGLADPAIYEKLRREFQICARPDARSNTSFRTDPRQTANRRAADVAKMIHQVTSRNFEYKNFRPTVLLDVGCDDGCNTAAVGKKLGLCHPSIHGCDVTDKSVPADVIYSTYDGFKLPFEDQTFDVVTAQMSLHHMHDPEAVMRDINRVMKPRGVLIIREHACESDDYAMVLDVVHGLYSLVWSNPIEWPEFCDQAEHGFCSRQSWRRKAVRSGFEVVQKGSREGALASYWDAFLKHAKDDAKTAHAAHQERPLKRRKRP